MSPANIHELYLALAGLPKDMEVKADAETGAPEKTVEELWRGQLGEAVFTSGQTSRAR